MPATAGSRRKAQHLQHLEIRVRATRPQHPLPGLAAHKPYAASCPELGLFCQADSEEEALRHIQSLIAFHLTRSDQPLDAHSFHGRTGVGAFTVVFYAPRLTQAQ